MKRTAKADLRAKSVEDLTKQADELRQQMLKGRMTRAVEGKGIGGKARQLRRQVARLETILGERRRTAVAPAKKA